MVKGRCQVSSSEWMQFLEDRPRLRSIAVLRKPRDGAAVPAQGTTLQWPLTMKASRLAFSPSSLGSATAKAPLPGTRTDDGFACLLAAGHAVLGLLAVVAQCRRGSATLNAPLPTRSGPVTSLDGRSHFWMAILFSCAPSHDSARFGICPCGEEGLLSASKSGLLSGCGTQ